jgi:hypothetical protein
MNTKERAALGGEAKQAKRNAALAARAATMPPLDSVENAKARLEIINDLAVSGMLPGSQAGAASRSIEIWLRAEAHALDLHRLKELERTITELEAELKNARRRAS